MDAFTHHAIHFQQIENGKIVISHTWHVTTDNDEFPLIKFQNAIRTLVSVDFLAIAFQANGPMKACTLNNFYFKKCKFRS